MDNRIISMTQSLIDRMRESGYAQNTIKVYEHSAFGPIIRHCQALEVEIYDQAVMDNLMSIYREQFERNELSRALFVCRKRGLLLLKDYHETGVFHQEKYDFHDVAAVPDAYSSIFANFRDSLTMSASTCEKIAGFIRKFFIFMAERGIFNVSDIRPDEVRLFLEATYENTPGSMDSVVYSLRHFFRFLENKGYDIRRIWIILSFPIRAKTIKPTFSDEEIEQILRSIDRNCCPGKRNFAILTLLIYTGIRAGDLISLKLTDICWAEGEIRIVQEKTGIPVSIPLQKPALTALADYILNERPKTKHPHVFLTCVAPHRSFSSGSEIDGILKGCMRKANIVFKKGDGKSTHGLRRYFATSVMSGGSTADMVAELLGHSGLSATRQYISIDISGMRRCVLPMSSLGGEG